MNPSRAAVERAFRAVGVTIRAVVLGELLFLAIVVLYALQSRATVFEYAGF